jgi:hypothetical protein
MSKKLSDRGRQIGYEPMIQRTNRTEMSVKTSVAFATFAYVLGFITASLM